MTQLKHWSRNENKLILATIIISSFISRSITLE
jgi:hypothetical protein